LKKAIAKILRREIKLMKWRVYGMRSINFAWIFYQHQLI